MITPVEHLRLVKSAIEHEDNLINHRLSWFFGAESFLFVATGIAQRQGEWEVGYYTNFYFPLLPLVGIATCVLTIISVWGGIAALLTYKRALEDLYRQHQELPLAPLKLWIWRAGLVTPILLPMVFLFAWALLLGGISR